MKTYTVKQVSEMLKIPKATLIYYDKLGIVKPQRGENGYRYYSEDDINDLKFVEIAKNIDYLLLEIRETLEYQKKPTLEGFEWQREFLQKKRVHLVKKQKHIQDMIGFIDAVSKAMEQKLNSNSSDVTFMRKFIDNEFENWRENNHEE